MTIIAVYGRDWSRYTDQMDASADFSLMCGWVVGVLVREDDEKLVIAHHFFPREDQVRHTSVIQKSCVIRRVEFKVKA